MINEYETIQPWFLLWQAVDMLTVTITNDVLVGTVYGVKHSILHFAMFGLVKGALFFFMFNDTYHVIYP